MYNDFCAVHGKKVQSIDFPANHVESWGLLGIITSYRFPLSNTLSSENLGMCGSEVGDSQIPQKAAQNAKLGLVKLSNIFYEYKIMPSIYTLPFHLDLSTLVLPGTKAFEAMLYLTPRPFQDVLTSSHWLRSPPVVICSFLLSIFIYL